jgi:hypothetical protein
LFILTGGTSLKKHLGIIAGSAIGVFIAASAYAQPPNTAFADQQCRNAPWCARDAHGTLVGVPIDDTATRVISGIPYRLINVHNDGVAAVVQEYFQNNTCSGAGYLSLGSFVLPNVQYDGQSIVAPIGTSTSFTWGSILTIRGPGQPNQQPCYNGWYCAANPDQCQFTGAFAKTIETITFYPPIRAMAP